MKKYLFLLLFINITVYSADARTVDYFLDMAFKNSPVLKSQIYRTNASKQSYEKESIFKKNPALSLGYSNIPLTEWPALDKHAMSGISIGVSQYIAMPWEDTYRKRTFFQKYLSEKEALKESKNLLAFQVQNAYHNILFLYKKKDILKKNKNVLTDILRLAESLVSVNKMNSSHLLKLKSDISVIANKILEVDGILLRTQANMEKLCGATLSWNITDETVSAWIDTDTAKDIPKNFNVKNHPLYKKIQALYKAQTAAYNLEIAKVNPGVTLGLDYRIRREIPGKDEGEDFISFKASAPIPLFYALKERHSIKAAGEKENEFREALRTMEIDLTSRWKGVNDNHRKLLGAFESFEKEVMPGYMAAYQAQVGSLSGGTINLLDVLDTYRLYLNASLEDARIYKDLMISKLRLNYLLYKFPGKNQIEQKKEN